MAEGVAPSSSPIFFQSSPTKGNNNAETPDERMADASSTVDDGERTPRGNTGVRGMKFYATPVFLFGHQIPNPYQTLPQLITSQVPAQPAASADQIFAQTFAPMP
jgi:hypothetical protein